MQDDMLLVNRRGRQACIQAVTVEPPDLSRVEVLELDTPERGLDVRTDSVLVSLVLALAHRVPHVREPPVQVLANRKGAGVEDQPAVPVSHRLGKLPRALLAGLPGDVAARFKPFPVATQ